MKIGNPVIREDMSNWLPPEGEEGVDFFSNDTGIVIEVKYSSKLDSDDIVKRRFHFKNVSHFLKGPIPSIDYLDFDFGDKNIELGSLIEFKESEMASKYTDFFSNNIGMHLFDWKHFYIAFITENLVFNIIATGVDYSE